ncbi:MAG: hypothetical protein LBP21_11110 [Synergistaceae bacterium]|jgi:hypothetical protein|nr:hypothetical protein [Synergistaceae bacterium]
MFFWIVCLTVAALLVLIPAFIVYRKSEAHYREPARHRPVQDEAPLTPASSAEYRNENHKETGSDEERKQLFEDFLNQKITSEEFQKKKAFLNGDTKPEIVSSRLLW